jgi:small subunit ribosomal protein S20
MANHPSARKRIRSNETKHLRNKYQWKTCKTAIKKLKKIQEKGQAEVLFREVTTLLDKAARRHIIHQNKAARKKSQLALHIQTL